LVAGWRWAGPVRLPFVKLGRRACCQGVPGMVEGAVNEEAELR
jgi:hypothetical protein